MSVVISLVSVANIVIVTERQVTINTSEIVVESVTDNPGISAIAHLSFGDGSGITKDVILWEGEEYNQIGQWTDTDVETRINQLLLN